MLELTDWVLVGLVCSAISLVFVSVLGLILKAIRDRDVERLYQEVDELRGCVKGSFARNGRAEKAERMQAAMIEVAAIMKNPEVADKQKAIMELALKYPDIAMDLIKKGI